MVKKLLLGMCLLGAVHAAPLRLKPAPKEAAILSYVTCMHSVEDVASMASYRLIEIDGSGTVAFNPIELILVVDGPEHDVPLLLELPRVSHLVKFEWRQGKLMMTAKLDAMGKNGIVESGPIINFEISKASVKDGVHQFVITRHSMREQKK